MIQMLDWAVDSFPFCIIMFSKAIANPTHFRIYKILPTLNALKLKKYSTIYARDVMYLNVIFINIDKHLGLLPTVQVIQLLRIMIRPHDFVSLLTSYHMIYG